MLIENLYRIFLNLKFDMEINYYVIYNENKYEG